jgi:hypothetical protein
MLEFGNSEKRFGREKMRKILLLLVLSTSLWAQLRPTPTNIPAVDKALMKVYDELNKLQKVTDTDCNDYVEMAGTLCKAIGIGTTKTNNAVTIFDKGELGSQTFTRGWQLGKGWKLYNDSSDYTLELDNLTLRGTLSVWELIINQIRATNGNLLVASVAKVSGSSGSYFDCEDVTGHGIAPFFVNDIIMCQVVNLSGATFNGDGDVDNNQYLVKRLIYRVSGVAGLRVTYTALAGTPANKGIPKKGDTFVRIGNTDLATNPTRGGTIGLYTDEVYSPFIRICDQVDSWADWKSIASVKTQLGRLGGLTDADFPEMKDEYGLYSKGGIYLKNGKIALADSGYIRSGQTAYHTGTGFWLGKTGGVGKFSVGNPAGNFLVWDGTQLYVNGNVTLSNSIPITNVTGLNDTIVNHRSAITLNAGNINLKVSRSTLLDSVVAYINLSPTTIDISASKVNVYGIFKAFNGSNDSTVIDGNKLKTGTVKADSILASRYIISPQIIGGSLKIGTGESALQVNGSGLYLGSETFADAEFRVTPAGALTATSANITGYLTTGTGDAILKVTSSGLQLGDATFLDAEFRVDMDGNLTATSATITGAIQTGSTITGATITGGTIQTATTGKRVVLNSDGDVQFYGSGGGVQTLGVVVANSRLTTSTDFEVGGVLYVATNISANSGNISANLYKVGGSGGTDGQYIRSNGTGGIWGSISASDLPSLINATKIADGTVTSAEFQYIGGLTSDAQSQINGKQAADADLTDLADGSLTLSKVDHSALTNGVMTVSYGTVSSTAAWTGTITIGADVYTVTNGLIMGKNL